MQASAVSFNIDWDPAGESSPSLLQMLSELPSSVGLLALGVFVRLVEVLDGVEYNPSLQEALPVPSAHTRTVCSQVATSPCGLFRFGVLVLKTH